MKRKVITIGDSVGITLPKELRNKFGLEPGDEVEIREDEAGNIELKPRSDDTKVDPEAVEWTNAFIDENRELLEKLSDA